MEYGMVSGYGVNLWAMQTIWNWNIDRKPLEGKDRALKPISEFLKGNCHLELLLNSYGFLLLEEKYKRLREIYCREYTEEAKELVGLEN